MVNGSMRSSSECLSRREFVGRIVQAGLVLSATGPVLGASPAAGLSATPSRLLQFPGPWAFQLPKSSIILVSDQQLETLQNPDAEIDLSLSATPNRTTLRQVCQQAKSAGARTIILAFDEFWSQYRPGQGGKPRALTPDLDTYIERIARISRVLQEFGLGLELSLLSPLEVGPGYARSMGESGRWVQYREGWRDPGTGRFEVALWEQRRWTNNKGTIELQRKDVRAFAFRERRVGSSFYYSVNPDDIIELKEPISAEPLGADNRDGRLRRLQVSGRGDPNLGPLDRVLIVVSYATPEMDYFSPRASAFLENLLTRYHRAGVVLHGLYADEMHIQQDWAYNSHHEDGQFALRYLTPALAKRYAELHGAEFGDFEKYLVYFCYGQHAFLPTLEAGMPAQHVFGSSPDEIQRTALMRRRYYDLLERTVVDLFVKAKRFAESLYGQPLESRAHATWAQSPTIDFWDVGQSRHAPHQYEYTPNFRWSNTVQQAAAACSDYFRWNDFLTGGGNDHAEGGWSDRNYYGLALACSTGILNATPNAYAAAWGLPDAAAARHQLLADAYGAAASPAMQAIQECAHRDIEVLMLYPISLVAAEERFGSWMVQFGYANYVTAETLLERGRIAADGWLEMAGRRFRTIAVLYEILPPDGLLALLEEFSGRGGKVVWSGPPPRFDLSGRSILKRWEVLFGVAGWNEPAGGTMAGGRQLNFEGTLRSVPDQQILTDFVVDWIYPIRPGTNAEVVARSGRDIIGVHRTTAQGGSLTYLGCRPRDDQAASLGREVRTWFEILKALGAYEKSDPELTVNDNPAVVSRESPYLCTRFPNGTTVVAAHYRNHVESWPGGFHRDSKQDAQILEANPLPSDLLELQDFKVNGHRVNYRGRRIVAFRIGRAGELIAFGGYDCTGLEVDNKPFRLSTQPFAQLAWAPVAEERKIPRGAVMEFWIDGEGDVSIPLPPQISEGQLLFSGALPGEAGQSVAAAIEGQTLKVTARRDWPQKHLYLVSQTA